MIREGGASAPATNVRYAQDWDGIRSFVQDAQWTHQSHSQLQELRPGNYFTFQLWGASDTGAGGAAKGTARYNIAVVDASVQPRVGVLIVPQGRETEFVFGEREGQEQLAKQEKEKRSSSNHHLWCKAFGSIEILPIQPKSGRNRNLYRILIMTIFGKIKN